MKEFGIPELIIQLTKEQLNMEQRMLKNKVIIFVLVLFSISCENDDNSEKNKINYTKIYNEFKKENVFSKFIGYHIVRRGNDQFFYKNLKSDSSARISIVYNYGNPKHATKLFFKQNTNSRMQLDKMNEYGIKAVICTNYDTIAKKIEYPEKGGSVFKNYQLIFALSDSIDMVNINFDLNDYYQLIKNHYSVVEKFDSNWLILKRL